MNTAKDRSSYLRMYNALIGKDGLDHAKRFVARQIAKGYVRLSKVLSPTGRMVWIPKDLKAEYIIDYNNGRILQKEVYDHYVNAINELETKNRRVKPLFDFDMFSADYKERH